MPHHARIQLSRLAAFARAADARRPYRDTRTARRRRIRHIAIMAMTVASLWLAGVSWPAVAAAPHDPIAAPSALEIAIGGRAVNTVASVTAAPGTPLHLEALGTADPADLDILTAGALAATRVGPHRWRIRVSHTPGVHPLIAYDRATGDALAVSVLVPQAFDPSQHEIDGYRIGHYQREPRHDNPIYDPPTALLRIDANDVDAPLAPDFTIGQFLCHQQPGHWPKFALVRPLLVNKLEAILGALRDRGIEASTLSVMSGYRTPYYNAEIGNTTVYSRHLYGGAADIFVDTDHDDEMDDLNGDGVVDVHDAQWLARLVDSLDAAHPRFAGGLSAYPATAYHGPFVHVDVRGRAVRW